MRTIGCQSVERSRWKARGVVAEVERRDTDDIKRLGVTREAAQDRAVWRGAIVGKRLTRASADIFNSL